MRIVQFNNLGRIANYPFEGVSAFGKTKRVGADIIGEYNGTATEGELPNYGGEWPIPAPPVYRTHITEGELIELMGEGPYTKAFRGAFPQGAAPADDVSLFFFERTRRPARNDGLVDVLSAESTAAFEHFIDKGYMLDADKIRIQQGIEE